MLFKSQIIDIVRQLPWVEARREQKSMRGIIEQQRRLLTKEQIREQSDLVISKLEQMSVFRDAKTVMVYYPVHHEVDLRPLMEKYRSEKTILLPVTHRRSIEVRPYDGEDNTRKGRFGIPEPQTPTYRGRIDLIIVPGVVFDHHCHRIGRGGGYYDRFLRRHAGSTKIGIGYDFQLKRHSIPHTLFDQRVNMVITPGQTIG